MRPKSLVCMSAQELADLRTMIEQENARRELLKSGSEAIKGITDGISQVAKNLKVSEAEILNAVVESVMGDDHAVYLKRGRKTADAPKKPGRPKKK